MTYRYILLASAALMVCTTNSLAQTSALKEGSGAADEPNSLEVVITGYRVSNSAAVHAKKQAPVILDAISQDDIGRLPDLNIVESARRIVGISTVGGLDPTKNRDIYQRVAIRGLDPKYNLITVDGVPLASSEWTVRGARLEQFPNSLVSRIEAIKTITAAYDPHGLGGQLNIVSRSAFSAKSKRFFALNASVGQNSTSGTFIAAKKNNLRADATSSTVFGDRGQWGLTISGEYQKLYSAAFSELPGDTDGGGWTYYTSSGSRTPFLSLSRDKILVPVRPQDFRFDNERTRKSLNGKLEYRLKDERGTISLFTGLYEDEDKEFRAEILTSPSGAPTNITSTTGTLPSGNLQQGIVLQPQNRKTTLITTKGGFKLTSDLDLNLVASYSDATYDEQRIFHKWATGVAPGRASSTNTTSYGYNYAITDGAPLATHLSPNTGVDPASYVNLYIRDVTRASDATVKYLKAELALNAASADQGFGGRIGINFTRSQQKFDVGYLELTPANAATQTQVGGLTNFIYDDRPISRDHAIVPYLIINPQSVLDYVEKNKTLFVETDQRANNFADDFKDVETVTALYAEGLYRGEKITFTTGLRYDATEVTADTYKVPTIASSTTYEPVSRSSDYKFILPSLLATYNITPSMRLTGGIGKTIGRPDFGQYAARTTYSIGTTPGTLSINTGNPELKPREAINYDFSYEWYLRHGGLFSMAAFYKDIKNEIFTGSEVGPATTYLGVTYSDVTIRKPLNSGKGKVRGLEITYTQNRFDFLPEALNGLGANLNLTLLNGTFDLPVSSAGIAVGQQATRKTTGLIQQPDYIANVTLFYTNGAVETRVSFNRIGRALQAANLDTPERDLYQEPRNQLDAQIRYSVNRNLDIVLQGQNLTNEAFVVRQGPDRAYLNNYFPVGSTLWIGVSWKPGK